jgi:hypothetical protein
MIAALLKVTRPTAMYTLVLVGRSLWPSAPAGYIRIGYFTVRYQILLMSVYSFTPENATYLPIQSHPAVVTAPTYLPIQLGRPLQHQCYVQVHVPCYVVTYITRSTSFRWLAPSTLSFSLAAGAGKKKSMRRPTLRSFLFFLRAPSLFRRGLRPHSFISAPLCVRPSSDLARRRSTCLTVTP